MNTANLTPNVKYWIGLTFEDTPDFWAELDRRPEIIPQAIAHAQQNFFESYPCLPFDELAKRNRSLINFEFFVVRRRFDMPQRSAYQVKYFNSLCMEYGFLEEVIYLEESVNSANCHI